MALRDVERLEVVIIVLDFRAKRNLITKPGEDRGDLCKGLGQRMKMAPGYRGFWDERDVDPFAVGQALETVLL